MENRFESYILDKLRTEGSIRCAQAAEDLKTTEVTIRSYLRKMAERDLLIRVRGGAISRESTLELKLRSGNVFLQEEKKRKIAEAAYEIIREGETIFLDDSSLAYYLAQMIKEREEKSFVVITNSLPCAVLLSAAHHIVSFLIGGQIGGRLPCTMGDAAVEAIRGYRADKAFIGAHGFNFEVGVTSVGSPQMQVKKAMLERSKDVYLMVTSDKFDGGYVMVVCEAKRLSGIITDADLSSDKQEQARELGIPLQVVS